MSGMVRRSGTMHEEEIIRNLPKALINWYAFNPGEEPLFVSGGDEAC